MVFIISIFCVCMCFVVVLTCFNEKYKNMPALIHDLSFFKKQNQQKMEYSMDKKTHLKIKYFLFIQVRVSPFYFFLNFASCFFVILLAI